jgi:hypothetical protein
LQTVKGRFKPTETMKMKAILSVLLFLILTSFKSDNSLPETFNELLKRSGLVFDSPLGLIPVKIVENRQMNYEYALKYPNKNFEIRYAIRPLDYLLNQFEKSKKLGEISINPNKLYSSSLQATVLNISGGKLTDIAQFDKNSVKQEFNADWGATTFLDVGKEFGQNYKYCMVVAIHKDNLADVYIFYLSDTKIGFNELVEPAFHSLKFK